MKPNIQGLLVPIDWVHLRHAALVPCAILLGVILIGAVVFAKDASRKAAAPRQPTADEVLYIGDSLSVGTFGELVSDYLVRTYSRPNIAFYASCGSSPENWLSGEPVFETKCGYRELVRSHPLIYGDPMRHRTPKIEKLLRDQKPTIVIVQQGTNWMDRSLSEQKIGETLDRFIGAIHDNTKCMIVWIAPPDSSRFRNIQGRICTLIQQHRHRGDGVIDSRRYTHYVVGKTGGDGVHYRSEAASDWAQRIIPVLNEIAHLRRRIAEAGKPMYRGDSQAALDPD
jgi:hypothetical protein